MSSSHTSPGQSVRVLMCDDHPTIVAGLRSNDDLRGVVVVGECNDPRQVIDSYKELQPDVVVLDICFPKDGSAGMRLCAELVALNPEVKIVLFSQFEQPELVVRAYKIGARCFLPKSRPFEELVDCILAVAASSTRVFPEGISQIVANSALGQPREGVGSLTDNELAAFTHFARGLKQEEVAAATGYSLRTVNTLFKQIKQKLGTDNPVEMAFLALDHGIINRNNSPLPS